MAYNIKYLSSYDTLNGVTCRIEIYLKNYTGPILPLKLAANPVVQKYQSETPKPPINGCSLAVNIINEGFTPITDFYSEDDDAFKIIHYYNNQTTFTGFLVLDDCEEEMVDYRHSISLSFNDNLGLLKSIALNAQTFDTYYVYESAGFALGAPNGVIISDNNYVPEPGVPFAITGTTFDGVFTPVSISTGSGFITVIVAETVTTHSGEFGFLSVTRQIDYFGYNNLLSVIHACMINTGLQLDTTVYAQIFEYRQSNDNSFLQQTYIDTQAFLDSSGFKNCWDVLEMILNRFKMTLFQQNGGWVIVRWDEMRYGNMAAFVYDSNFKLSGTDTISNNALYGFQQSSFPVNLSAIKSVERPYKYDKETFNYEKPEFLILNSDLQKLGAFIGSTVDGDFRTDKYQFPSDSHWLHMFTGTVEIDRSYIAVVTQISLDNETDRYVYQPKTNTGGGGGYRHFANVQFNNIQVSQGDIIDNFSFSIRTAQSTGTDNVIYRVALILQADGGSYWFLNNNPTGDLRWQRVFSPPTNVTANMSVTVLGTQPPTDYYNYTLISQSDNGKIPPFPSDGILYIRIYGTNDSNASQPQVDAIWKDLKLTITEYINASTQIIGHVHKQEQPPSIKNNGDETIYIDDSPKSTIKGALFLVSYFGFVRVKTALWYRKAVNPAERLKLGELTTLEQLAERKRPRAKIEGQFKGIQSLGPLVRVLYVPYVNIRFVHSSMEISFRNNSFQATLFEMPYNEPDAFLTNNYTFTYIYNTK